MEIGEALSKQIIKRGWTDPYTSSVSGVSRSTITNVRNGKRSLSVDALAKLFRVFGLDLGEALAQESAPREAPRIEVLSSEVGKRLIASVDYVAVPILEEEIAANVSGSVEITGSQIKDHAVIYRKWATDWRHFVCVEVAEGDRGQSMMPTIQPGYIVGINLSAADSPASCHKQIVAARIDDGVAIKRAWVTNPGRKCPNGRLALTSDGNGMFPGTYPPLIFDGEEANGVILGKVEWWWGRQE